MQRAFHYRDQQSDKFWWIDYDGCDFVTNHGKTGTAGKYQIKEFDSEAECIKQAEKLIASKLKKGYVENPAFDFHHHSYFDDEEYGLHPKTSHPNFTAHFNQDFYYDCSDEESPFGSDEGADALSMLEEAVRRKPRLDFAAFPRFLIEGAWAMKYIPADNLDEDEVRRLLTTDEMNLIQSDMITYAVAFGQIKITGQIDPILKDMGLNALRRFQLICRLQGWGDGQPSAVQARMIEDLTRFASVR